MAIRPEDEAILKPIWSPLPEQVRRSAGKWRLWVLGPRPEEGGWYPRDDFWVWKWLVPQVSDHGEWLWWGEEPLWEQLPDSRDMAWRLVSERPRLIWEEVTDAPTEGAQGLSPFERVWTEDSGVVCFHGSGSEVLQFVAITRASRFATDRTTLVMDQEVGELPLHEELMERMKLAGMALPPEITQAISDLAPPSEHFSNVRDHSLRAIEHDFEVAVGLIEGEIREGEISEQNPAEIKRILGSYLRLLCLKLNLSAVELDLGQEPIQFWAIPGGPSHSLSQVKQEIPLSEGVLKLFWSPSETSSARTAVLASPEFSRNINRHLKRLMEAFRGTNIHRPISKPAE